MKNKAMKRIISKASLLVMLSCMFSAGSYAQEYTTKDITVMIPGIKLIYNGEQEQLSAEPFIYENRVYLPLDAVSKMMGSEITLDPDRPYIYISRPGSKPIEIDRSKGYDYVQESLSRPYDSYEDDKEQKEMERLKYELAKERKKNEILSGDYGDYDEDEDLDDIEDEIRDDYDRYTKGDKVLEFDIKLSWSSGDVKVKMEGDFDKGDSGYWDKRDKYEFRDYIEDICRDITRELKEDVRVYVEDEEGDDLARYNYDYSDKDIDVDYER